MRARLRARGLARLVFVLPALAISSCAAADDPGHEQIMDRIEAKLRLPAGASPLGAYARTYAYAADGKVVGNYFVPMASSPADAFCQGAKRYGRDNGQIALACPPPDGMAAGQRRWYAKPGMLPQVDDGGCAFVDIEFDPKTSAVLSAECHGPA